MEMHLGDERIELRATKGTTTPAGRRATRRSAAGRICAEDGCDTRLSIYNRAIRCWQHEPARRYLPVHGGRRSEDPAPPGDVVLLSTLERR
jgi:hypothetical protein